MAISLPRFPHLAPLAMHPSFDQSDPDSDRFERATRAYADRFRLYQDETQRERLALARCGQGTSFLYPAGSDELLQLAADFFTWAVAYDDEYCDEGPLSKNYVKFIQASAEIWRQFESPEYKISDDKYALAARDLRVRLDRYAKPEQVGHMVESMQCYLMGKMWKAINRRPLLNDYLSMICVSGSTLMFVALVQVVPDIYMPEREYRDRRVTACSEMIAFLSACDSDLYAFEKEVARNPNEQHNMIRVLMRERGYGEGDAIEEYMRRHSAVLGLFVRLRKDIEKSASDGLMAYLEALGFYFTGTMAWTYQSLRYRSASRTDDDTQLFTGGQHDYEGTPEKFSEFLDVVDVPSVRWWWEYDPARRKSQSPLSIVARQCS